MAGLLKLNILILTLVSFVASSSRERRFLLEVLDGARDITPKANKEIPFSWDFGDGEFSLKNRDAVIMALSDSTDVAYAMMNLNLVFFSDANAVRSIVNSNAIITLDNTHQDKWKAAADILTDIHDATETVVDVTLHYMIEILTTMDNQTTGQPLQGLLDMALRNSVIAIVRVDNLVSEAWGVLLALRDADTKNTIVTGDINTILAQFIHLEDLITELKSTNQRLIAAADIEADD